MPDHSGPSSGTPGQPRSLLELVGRLSEEFPDLSPHTVIRCVSIVAHHPGSTALNFDALLRHTERIARARLTHLTELPGQPLRRRPDYPEGPPIGRQRDGGQGQLVAST
jgi:hypothetical protein